MIPLRVDLGIMAMKRYFTLPKSSELEPHHQVLFRVIFRISIFGGALPLYRAYSRYIVSPTIKAPDANRVKVKFF